MIALKNTLWIGLLAVLGAATGVLTAVYLPVWVDVLLTLILLVIAIVSLFDYGYFGQAWIIMAAVTIFSLPLWAAWFVVSLTQLVKSLQTFP